MRRPRKGFTLIELLMVIVIIAMLAALLFPVFRTARDKAKQASCASNLRQIWMAFRLFGEANNGEYPKAFSSHWVAPYDWWLPSQYRGYQPSIKSSLGPYIRHDALWHCPGDWGEFQDTGIKGRGSLYEAVGASYDWRGLEYAMYDTAGPKTMLAGKKEGVVSHPSSYSLAWDHRPWHFTCRKYDFYTYEGLKNVLFCDGHVTVLMQSAARKLELSGPDDPLPPGVKP